MTAISVTGVSMSFDDGDQVLSVLDDVTLHASQGEFVSCVGPSGCGKTTLLRLMAGALSPSAGTITVGDRRSDKGVVFQDHSLLPWRTILDNVAFGLKLRGVPKKERRRRAAEVVDMVGLGGFEESYPYQLSGGMKQRANLARALAIEPHVLLMDEPFASLDSQTREVMQSELLQIWGQTNKTVLFITHQIDEAVYLADRVVVFSGRPGRVVADINVDLERPRDLRVKRDAAFVKYVDEIWDLLEDDVRRTVDGSR